MEKGLSSLEAQEKLNTFGLNEITVKKAVSPFVVFLSQFPTVINAILAIAAIFSIVIGGIFDGIFIFAILLLNGFFGFIQEYRAEKSLEKLKNFVKPFSRVLRDGKEIKIPTSQLVPGDTVILSEGELIPADGSITTATYLEVDESILTGESIPVAKKLNGPLFKGTLVTKGRGHFLVEKTGISTRLGEITQTLSQIKTEKTPLQKKLDDLGKILSIIAIVFSLLLIPIGILQERSLFPLILLSISIGIAAIPEGLPAVITIALAIGSNRMAKRKAIVRKMPAIETLGSTQIILLDKTGTLTQNRMKVKKFWVKDNSVLQNLLMSCVLGNTATLIQKSDPNECDIIGDKTDGALLLWSHTQTKDINSIKTGGKILDEHVFDPVTKTVTILWQPGSPDSLKNSVFVRGAPETILSKSSLNTNEQEKIRILYESYAKEGLRVIGFGSKIITAEKHGQKIKRDELEKDLDFIGLIGIYDPPRPETKQAVIKAKNAGIKTIMVTGDNALTALAIAKEVGLIEEDEDVVTGEDLDKLSDADLEKIIIKTRIFARTKPEDKLRLVTVLKKLGFVVGVTGDGVNDALALRKADVGIAMGEKGTDVAKETSDIILVDDNFSTLIHAISEGRTIYNNIIKSVVYLLSGNLSELSLIFFATVLGMPAPLLPTQILWINLVTDGLPALALASDKLDNNLLNHMPRNPQTPILTKSRLIFITSVGFGISIFLLFVFKFLLLTSGELVARTITFNLLIFIHPILALVIRGRSLTSINSFLALTIIGTILVQILINTIPLFQQIFHLGLR